MPRDYSASDTDLGIQSEHKQLMAMTPITHTNASFDNGGCCGVEQRQTMTNGHNRLLWNLFSQNLETVIINLISSPHHSQW